MAADRRLTAIENTQIVLENGIIWDGILLIEGDRICSFGKASDITIPPQAHRIDANGAYVGPGFVDIHVHGGGGYSTCFDPEQASDFFLRHGTTSMLAGPSYTMNFDEFLAALRSVKAAIASTKTIRGLYLEGEIGSIAPGKKADLVFVDDKFHVQQVMLDGEMCVF